MDNVAYMYSGEIELTENDFIDSDFFGFAYFYEKVKNIVANKLGVNAKNVEIGKVSGYAGRTTIKVDYKLHYRIDRDLVKSTVRRMISYEVSDISMQAVNDREFKVCAIINCFNEDTHTWKKVLVPEVFESKLKEVLPEGIIPRVTFTINYPVTTIGRFSIDWWREVIKFDHLFFNIKN